MTQIFVDTNKGDFLFKEWEEESMKEYKDKILELTNSGYELVDENLDYLNQYEYYKNKDGHEIIVTILCC